MRPVCRTGQILVFGLTPGSSLFARFPAGCRRGGPRPFWVGAPVAGGSAPRDICLGVGSSVCSASGLHVATLLGVVHLLSRALLCCSLVARSTVHVYVYCILFSSPALNLAPSWCVCSSTSTRSEFMIACVEQTVPSCAVAMPALPTAPAAVVACEACPVALVLSWGDLQPDVIVKVRRRQILYLAGGF